MTEFLRTKQYNRLYIKVPLIIIAMLIVAAAVIVVRGFALKHDIDRLADDYKLEKSNSFKASIDTSYELEHALARDYSIWDELIDAMQGGNIAWLQANIEPALSTYHSTAAWVIDDKFNVKYATFSEDQAKDLAIPTDLKNNHTEIFKNGYFVDYFTTQGNEIYRIETAPIQPTADVERQTKPKGFFVVAKRLNAEFVEQAEKSNSVQLKLQQTTADKQSNDLSNGIIRFTQPMQDWRGNEVAHYSVSIKSDFLSSQLHNLSMQYKLFSLLIAFVFIGIALIGYFVISAPLKVISDAIRTGDEMKLKKMMARKDELGDISRLVEKNIKQTQELRKSYLQKEQAEKRAQQRSDQYERVNNLMVGRELKMIELKKEISELKKRLNGREDKK